MCLRKVFQSNALLLVYNLMIKKRGKGQCCDGFEHVQMGGVFVSRIGGLWRGDDENISLCPLWGGYGAQTYLHLQLTFLSYEKTLGGISSHVIRVRLLEICGTALFTHLVHN